MSFKSLKKIIAGIFLLTLVNAASYAQENAFEPVILKPGEVMFSHVSTKVDSIDPVFMAGYYPGGRGVNKLVIYTPNYGIHTGTNEFGTEAIVQGNAVTVLSGADSTIPGDGLVISGHGTAKNWMNNNITVGSKVYVDVINKIIHVYTTSDSYTYEAYSRIDEAKSIVDYYKNTLPDYNYSRPNKHIVSAQNYLKIAQTQKNNSTVLKQYAQAAIDEANMALKTSLPYIENELKGIWLRPVEKTDAEIISTLDTLHRDGFNNIFLETYFHGRTIYPSKIMDKYGFVTQNEKFVGSDPLKTWIVEAHKRNMKVHIWFQSFYVGNNPPSSNPKNILAVRPEWGNKTHSGADSPNPTKSVSEHNGYFLDPANSDVQLFLEELISEIMREYKPDGINLDYIRYPNTVVGSVSGAWGYTKFAREDFQKIYGIDPYDLSTADELWYDWNRYRRNKVTQFVRKIGKIGKENKIYISAVIFPDLTSALSMKHQDWRTWSKERYIDGFTPLFLTYDSKMLSSMMDNVMRVKTPETNLYAGLFVTFMDGSSEDLVKQIFETRKLKANGIILFDYAHTTPVYRQTLMAGAFNPKNDDRFRIAGKSNKNSVKKPKKVKSSTNSKGFWLFSAD